MAFLDVKEVSKHYDNHTALDGVSLSITQGSVFGLLGPNGAGKTTLIRMITQITAPDQGEILLEGIPLRIADTRRIGYLPEERGLYPKMKVGEHILYLARLRGLSRVEAQRRLDYWFEKFDIQAWCHKKVGELSKGMQQKLQFICAVIHNPELLILDEPFSGFDPINAELLKQEILELKDKGHTIIFSTHNMQSVEEICDDIALIAHSKLILAGAVEDIRQSYTSDIIELGIRGQLGREELYSMQPLSHVYRHGVTSLRLRKSEGQTNREFLLSLPENLSIISFGEEVPSMHEIFLTHIGDSIHE